jgi:prepilin-type N-terminal cleavage/methylation domain-containing protein
MNHCKKIGWNTGFTMLESLVAVMMVCLFAAIAIPRFFVTRDHGELQAAEVNLTAIRHGLAVYAADHDHYPPTVASYEEFKRIMTDANGRPYLDVRALQPFRWITYISSRDNDYVLIIQALDHGMTLIQATSESVQIKP